MFTLPLILLLYNDESLIIFIILYTQLQVGGSIGPGKGKALGSAIYFTFNTIESAIMQIISLNDMVELSPSIMIIIILITIPMLGPECKYLNGPEISFRSEAVFAACRLVGHIWDSTHIASNHLSVGQDLSANELIFVSTWFAGKRG